MDCDKFSSMIDMYLDDALPEGEKEAFLAHLRQCGKCRAQMELASEALDLTHGLKQSAPDFIAPAVKRLARHHTSRRRWISGLVGMAAALILCCAVLVTQMGIKGMNDKGASPQSAPDLSQQQNEASGGEPSLEEGSAFRSEEERSQRMEDVEFSQGKMGQVLSLDARQAAQLLSLLKEDQKQLLMQGEGGSYLPLTGRKEQLLPLLKKCGVEEDIEAYDSLFLPEH